jgi:hypothetical protein
MPLITVLLCCKVAIASVCMDRISHASRQHYGASTQPCLVSTFPGNSALINNIYQSLIRALETGPILLCQPSKPAREKLYAEMPHNTMLGKGATCNRNLPGMSGG